MDCVFCKIIKGEIPCYKIYEDRNFLAILDIYQFTRGHTLVVPKKHARWVWEVKEGGKYFAAAQKIANHFRSLGYDYVDTMIFGRDVPHAHIHLIPHKGEAGDYQKALENLGVMQKDPLRRLTTDEGKKIAEEFKLG
jgi:histidine triad (HIT) family protein